MTTDRFDQRPGPYGRCLECEAVFATPEEEDRHRAESLRSARAAGISVGHTTRCDNPIRSERIERYVHGVMEDVLREYGDLDGWELVMNEDASEEIVGQLLSDIWAGVLTGEEASDALCTLREPDVARIVAEEAGRS